MRKLLRLLLLCVVLLSILLTGCKNKKKELTVSAAASLTEVMNEIEPLFEKKYKTDITINLASSGTLQKQIEEGAPVDVFLSASKAKMDKLDKKELIDKDTRKNLLKNQLTLIVSKTSSFKISSLKDLDNKNIKISIGEPGSVPVGKYAKQSLEHYKLWNKLKDHLIFAKNVKQVLSYVESGEADAGIVYNSDATVLKNSIIAQKISTDSHSEIVYPVAVIKNSKNKDTAKEFVEFLNSDEAKKIIKKYNFLLYTK